MPENLPPSDHESVRYNILKNPVVGQQSEDVYISSSNVNRRSNGLKGKLPKLKTFCLINSIFVFLIIIIGISGAYFYHTRSNALHSSGNACVSFNQLDKLIIVHEVTDFNSCLDNRTCHTFVNAIEQKHDGSKYNFVVGEEGELYIGSGFKCLANNDEKALYVKILTSNKPREINAFRIVSDSVQVKNNKICNRLSELIRHGISCGKIASEHKIETVMKDSLVDGYVRQGSSSLVCIFALETDMKTFHVHDPNHEKKLIHSDFAWTSCGYFSTTKNTSNHKIVTLESLPKNSCPPLKRVNHIVVDVVEKKSSLNHSSTLQEYDEHHEGFKYNFIIDQNSDVYVGLGFKCKAADLADGVLKIKILRGPREEYSVDDNNYQFEKYILLLEEGFACGRISEYLDVKLNCDWEYGVFYDCGDDYKIFDHIKLVKLKISSLPTNLIVNRTVDSEDGKGIVPREERYQYCHRNQSHRPELASTIAPNTTNMSCTPFEKVSKVMVIRENFTLTNETLSPKDVLEHENDWMNFNFVFLPKGILYIGAGFKCLKKQGALKVKLLESLKDHATCMRLAEIIHNGILCGKISQIFSLVANDLASAYHYDSSCTLLGSDLFKNKSNHIHDPDYKMGTIIPHDSGWSFCGNYTNKTTEESEKTPTNSLPESCTRLEAVNEIIVDIEVEEPQFKSNCEDYWYSTCLKTFEEQYDGLKYNFVVNSNEDVYVGAGYRCAAEEGLIHTIKIKVLMSMNVHFVSQKYRLKKIIIEGSSCGILSNNYHVKVNCLGALERLQTACEHDYLQSSPDIRGNVVPTYLENRDKTIVELGRVVIPNYFDYLFCRVKEDDKIFWEDDYVDYAYSE
ncbi:uncharacterized protein LOC128993338 [Macrosteles quadrilineatus]|uniref:uncharacterized protein LOC128993338 n=1 Tax=Macrosteles quadrilineatus TaxID=74068 RepID=UPI0023E142EA|nr:uncharacterized protein LOC128993338 [Macrosteles quadrilineatus]